MCGHPAPPCENALMSPEQPAARTPPGADAPYRDRHPRRRARRPGDRGDHQPARAAQRRRQRLRRRAPGGLRGLRPRRRPLGGRADRRRRDVLCRGRPQGGGRGRPATDPRPRDRAHGPHPPDPVQAGDRRRRGVRRGRAGSSSRSGATCGWRPRTPSSACSAGASACRCATSARCGCPGSWATAAPWTSSSPAVPSPPRRRSPWDWSTGWSLPARPSRRRWRWPTSSPRSPRCACARTA